MENVENNETLEGIVDEIIYKNHENGYIILVLNVNETPQTVVGTLGDIVEGETLRLQGSYVENAKYGRQFKAVTCERTLPKTEEEIRRYLGSGIIKGIGPSMAKKIVAAFGTNALTIIEAEPQRLSSVNGISVDKALFIGTEFRRLNGMKSVVEFLKNYDISPITAAILWKLHEGESILRVKENPYMLCDGEFMVDFSVADRIASDLGLSEYNVNRVRAGIGYVLRENAFAGHTCLPRERLSEKVCQTLRVDEDSFDNALFEGIKDGVFFELEMKRRTYVYLAEYYLAENYIAEKTAAMLKLSIPLEKDYSDEIAKIEESEGIKYESLQKAAINAALGNNLFILTGGPGTGKTTTLNAIIRICIAKKKRLLLAAPTGRAAKRMSELTGQNAKTIHRMLEVDFSQKTNTIKFKHNEKNPLKADVIIIDEMSMVDALLFNSLLRAIKPESKLILVGDSNQLPSVGAGNVLKDLIATDLIPTIELKEIFRQAAESLIVTNAHSIVHGRMPELNNRKKDFFFIPTDSDENTAEKVLFLTRKGLPSTYGYSPIEDIQVLSPTKMGTAGTKNLNKLLQQALNPPDKTKKELRYIDVVFRMNDKVMQIKNDYDVVWRKDGKNGTGVFNGDIGTITGVDTRNSILTINFDGREAVYTSEMFGKLEHAYAVTIHKSQGSEYKAVIMPLTMISENLLYRNLLYTGVTRAKEILVIIGSEDAVREMVRNDRKTYRYSCIKALLEELMS